MQITISQKVWTSPKSQYALPIHRRGRIFKKKWSSKAGLVVQSKTTCILGVVSVKGSFYWILTDKEKMLLLSNIQRKYFILILAKWQSFITKLHSWYVGCLKQLLWNRQVAGKDLTGLVSQHSWELRKISPTYTAGPEGCSASSGSTTANTQGLYVPLLCDVV